MPRPRTGGVEYRRGRWYARITLSREPRDVRGQFPRALHPITREGQPVTGEGRADEAYARRAAAHLQQSYDEGVWSPERAPDPAPAPPPPQITVAEWCTAWLATQTYSNAAKERKVTAAALKLRDDRGWCFGELAVARVTPRDVAAWLAVLRATKTAKGKLPAPRTVRNAYDPVARALRSAVFEGLLAQDPCAVLPTEHRPQSVDADPLARAGRRLARHELETLLGEPGIEERWSVFWHLLALTGAREGEAIALRWCDLLPDTPLARVRIMAQVHHRTRTREPTKTGVVREVPLHPLLRDVLEAWASAGWQREYGRAPRPEDLIVPSRGEDGRPWGTAADAGGPLWQQNIHRALQRDLTGCCLGAHRVHDLRHTFVSLCADAGIAADVATRWTHAPAGTTARYLYLVPSWERQCTEMLRLVITPRRRAVVVPEGTPRALPGGV